jgi:hypothetical protein
MAWEAAGTRAPGEGDEDLDARIDHMLSKGPQG